jgi:RHS repeat-associated protein
VDDIRQKFVGYERDIEDDLDFAQARYYNSKHGRFTSVDPLMASANISSPQTFNRYSYVLNNPLNLTDPLGTKAGCPEGQKCQNDENGNEYYLDKDGKQVYTSTIAETVVVAATTAVAFVATQTTKVAEAPVVKSSVGWLSWFGSKVWQGTKFTGRAVTTGATGVVGWILTNPTEMGPPPRTDGCPELGCAPEPKVDDSANPNPDDNKPNTDATKSPTSSKTQTERPDSGLVGYTDEEVTEKSKDRSLPKAERQRFKKEDKIRGNRKNTKQK